jgi:hypothetical protein
MNVPEFSARKTWNNGHPPDTFAAEAPLKLSLSILLLAASLTAAPGSGYPKAKGLGRSVILTNLPARSAEYKAVKRLSRHRSAKILRFRDSDVGSVRKELRRAGPEFVAVAVLPTTVDMNFQLALLELCRGLDDDPMPDFYFGYLCARDGADLMALVERIIERESNAKAAAKAKVVPLSGTGDHLRELDYILHFGHGQPWRVDGGLTGEQVGALRLERAPVVWSGACFGGVLSRSYHKSAYHLVHSAPTTITPTKLLALNWVHAGLSGYFAALEADRGEMAMAEWDYFRERACSLGEVIGYQYRLAFVSLPADFKGFRRFTPGRRKNMSFYGVMLNGMVSRIVISDPMYRPLRKPLDDPASRTAVVHDADQKTLTVTIAVRRWSQGQMLNYLPKPPSDRFDRRLYARVRLPDSLQGSLGEPAVRIESKKNLEVTRFHVRRETWGGARYLNLQVEAPAGLGSPGTRAIFMFPIGRRR